MSEADWWLCARCQSLNSLSARKCYSCRAKKPKDAARASEVLGYRVVESWDGKVSLEQLPVGEPAEAAEPDATPEPSPIRDPIPRSVIAVAPPPPHGASITYRPVPVPPSTPGPAPPASPWVSDGPLPPPAMRGVPPFPPPAAPPPDLVAVGPGRPPADAPPDIPGQSQEWPHWHELLDLPAPDGERVRATYDETSDDPAAVAARSREHGGTLGRAIRSSMAPEPSPEAEWRAPEVEWPAPEAEWPATDRAPGTPGQTLDEAAEGGAVG